MTRWNVHVIGTHFDLLIFVSSHFPTAICFALAQCADTMKLLDLGGCRKSLLHGWPHLVPIGHGQESCNKDFLLCLEQVKTKLLEKFAIQELSFFNADHIFLWNIRRQ
jgi:hypothetical protein